MDDRILMKEISSRNVDSFKELLDKYIPIVSRTSYRIMCDRSESEYITHAVFKHLWRRPSSYPASSELVNQLLNHTCRLCRRRLFRQRVLAYLSVNPVVYVVSAPSVQSADEYIVRQAWEIFCRASGNCSDNQRIVYALSEIEGIPDEDIGKITGPMLYSPEEMLEAVRRAVLHELDHYGRMNDYDRYIRFLRMVEDQLTDKVSLQRTVMEEIIV